MLLNEVAEKSALNPVWLHHLMANYIKGPKTAKVLVEELVTRRKADPNYVNKHG